MALSAENKTRASQDIKGIRHGLFANVTERI